MIWIGLAAALAVATGSGEQSALPKPVPTAERSWSFLSEFKVDSAFLQSKLAAAQAGLKRGDPLYFYLLSGAPASYSATNIPPRKVFLEAPFDHPVGMLIRPQPNVFKMEFARDGNALVTDVTIVLNIYGELERVELLQRAPNPF